MAEIREDTAGTHMGTWQGLNMQFFKFVGGKCVLLQVSWVTSAICCHVPRYIRGLQVQHVIMSLVYPCPYCFRNPVSLSIPCYIGTRSHELIYISNLDLNRNKNANLEERTIRKKNSLSNPLILTQAGTEGAGRALVPAIMKQCGKASYFPSYKQGSDYSIHIP